MFATLLTWIRCTEVEFADVAETRTLVQNCIDSMAHDDPRRPQLAEILERLWEGLIPVELFLKLDRDWKDTLPSEQPGGLQDLEQEYRLLASSFDRTQWISRSYQRLSKALQDWDEGLVQPLCDYLDSKRQLLEEAWTRYERTPVLCSEITAETIVGHRLLQESIDLWLQALDLVEQATETGQPFSDALALAERGNRLLVAVERLNERTQSQARAMAAR